MKRIMFIALLASAVLMQAAAYSIVLPSSPDGDFSVIADDGQEIALDEDYIWYKMWNGLILEQIDDGVFTITDEYGAVSAIVPSGALGSMMRFPLMSLSDARTVIIHGPLPSYEVLEDTCPDARIVVTSPRQDRQIEILRRKGLDVVSASRSGIVDIVDGKAMVDGMDGETVIVVCPHCRTSFSVRV